MDHYAEIDVSLEQSSVCVVDASGKIIREDRVASDPPALMAWFGLLRFGLTRIGVRQESWQRIGGASPSRGKA